MDRKEQTQRFIPSFVSVNMIFTPVAFWVLRYFILFIIIVFLVVLFSLFFSLYHCYCIIFYVLEG